MEATGNGRAGSFLAGTQTGQYHTLQQDLPEGFHPSSVLEKNQVLRPANGTSESDRSRQTMNGTSRNLNGQSSQTFDDSMWTSGIGRTRS